MVVVKEEVRAQIVAVSRKIFTRYGFRKTTMEEIARVTGMGKSSIYYYFKSKEEIFKAVVEKEAEELKNDLDNNLIADSSPTEKLKVYIMFRLHHVRSVSNFYAALKDENLAHMEFILDVRKKFDRQELAVVRDILEKGVKGGSFQISDPNLGAIAIATMMKGLELPLFLNEELKTSREHLLDDLIRVIFYGIIKR